MYFESETDKTLNDLYLLFGSSKHNAEPCNFFRRIIGTKELLSSTKYNKINALKKRTNIVFYSSPQTIGDLVEEKVITNPKGTPILVGEMFSYRFLNPILRYMLKPVEWFVKSVAKTEVNIDEEFPNPRYDNDYVGHVSANIDLSKLKKLVQKKSQISKHSAHYDIRRLLPAVLGKWRLEENLKLYEKSEQLLKLNLGSGIRRLAFITRLIRLQTDVDKDFVNQDIIISFIHEETGAYLDEESLETLYKSIRKLLKRHNSIYTIEKQGTNYGISSKINSK